MAKKSFKKFAGTGKLKSVIDARRAHQKTRKLVDGREKRKSARNPGAKDAKIKDDEDEDDEEMEVEESGKPKKGKKNAPSTVDDLMGADFMEGEDDEDETPSGPQEAEDDDDDASLADTDDDFASLDDLDEREESHKHALANLAQTDPEFYKYLQENDKELLEFGQDEDEEEETKPKSKKQLKREKEAKEEAKAKKGKKAAAVEQEAELGEDEYEEFEGADTDDEDMEEEELRGKKGKKGGAKDGEVEIVTMEMLKGWQKGMLETRSLRSLRRLLLAFRAAAHSNSDSSSGPSSQQSFAYTIESPAVFNKLLLTTLKFTPLVLAHHLPFRVSPTTGRYKMTKSAPPALMKMVLSYMANLMHLIGQLPDEREGGNLIRTVLVESGKMVPWILGARKTVRGYLKMLLDLWSSGSDGVRIACFLNIRKIVAAADESIKDMVLKGIYLSLLRSCKQTSIHTLPSINLMKNSASEIYVHDHAAAYQHAFGYIRQLAVHLRNSMRVKTKDSYKAVYNWQFVHCIDFWSLVLSTACSRETQLSRGGVESELQPLIYPLVQVTLGVIRLIPTSRYFPLRFHLLRSLLRLSTHTATYIPLTPSLLEPLASAEFTQKPKPSTLAPLDFEYVIRAPTAYPRTRQYQDGLAEEISYLLLESQALMSTSIAFPELAIPVTTVLRRFVKKGKSAGGSGGGNGGMKVASLFKVLIEKIEATSKLISEKRKAVEFAPNDRQGLEGFMEGVSWETTPLGMYWKLQKKVRDAKRREVEKAAREERGPEENPSEGEDGSDDGEEPEEEFEDDEMEGELEMEED